MSGKKPANLPYGLDYRHMPKSVRYTSLLGELSESDSAHCVQPFWAVLLFH